MADWTLGAGPRRAAAAPGASLTAAQHVHERLRDEIVSLRRRPGEAIYEKEIAQEAQVSRTPVREALLRLADEKLVEIVPKSGTIVARIPVANLPEIILARTALESLTVRAAAERARGSDVAGLRAILELQRETLAAGDLDGFHTADETMHRAIAEAAGLPGIWAMVQQIKVQLDRYRRLTLPQPQRMATALAEHEAIVDAIAARDADGATTRIRAHLERLTLGLEAIRDLNPDYFVGDVEAVFGRWGAAVR